MGVNVDTQQINNDIMAAQQKESDQKQFEQQLADITQGKGPSLSGQLLQQQAMQNAQATNALIAGQRGVNTGMALRQALQQQGLANQQAMQQAQVGRSQEQMGALGLRQQQYQANRQFDLAQRQQQQQYDLGVRQINAGIEMQNAANTSSLLGGVIGGGAGIGAAALMSDENQKTDIQDGDQAAYDFLDALQAHKYKYKDASLPGAAPGEQLGVMAQDVEQSPGAQMVQDTPQGKMLDPSKGFGAVLAAQANLHERLKALEGGKGYAAGGFVDYSIPLKQGHGGQELMGASQGIASMMSKRGMAKAPVAPTPFEPEIIDQGGYMQPMVPAGATDIAKVGQMYAAHGAYVPGKAKVAGDSPKNDTVPAMLSPGEIVIPRSKAKDADKAKAFIDELMRKKKAKDEPTKSGYSKILELHRQLGEALGDMES